MPHAFVKTNKTIKDLDDDFNIYYGRKNAIIPLNLKDLLFFVELHQKPDGILIKLEKSTRPIITNNIKDMLLLLAKTIEKSTSGTIVTHNLYQTKECMSYGLSDNILCKYQLKNSSSITKLFSCAQNIHLEIGCGDGEFIINQALANPYINFIGLEISNKEAKEINKKLFQKHLKNLKFILYDVNFVIDLFETRSIDKIYLNFPEPWFKQYRIKHSILNKKIIINIERILKPNGILSIKTDNYPFVLSTINNFYLLTSLQSIYKYAFILDKHPINTRFEKKWIRKNREIYSIDLKKTNYRINKEKKINIQFPIKLHNHHLIDNNIILKVKDIYINKYSQSIIKIIAGDVIKPQCAFFDYKNGYINITKHTIFTQESSFLQALFKASLK